MTLRQRFATLLRQHRGERALDATADAVGAHASDVLWYEAGGELPPLPVYVRLCRWYGLTPAQRAELDEIVAGMGTGGAA